MVASGTMKRACVVLGLAFLLSPLGCQGDEECKGWAGSNGRADWGSCGDKRDRKVECDVRGAAPLGAAVPCRCSLGGVIGKSFQMELGSGTSQLGSFESATKTANEQCGWKLSR